MDTHILDKEVLSLFSKVKTALIIIDKQNVYMNPKEFLRRKNTFKKS